jgi:hypothetical protein
MKRARKILLIVCGVVVLLIVIGAIYIYRPPNDGRTPAERRQIADALLTMLHSPLTNEVDDIKPDDSRVPEVIRALHPVGFMIVGNDAVVFCAGKPAEYHLSHRSSEPKTWILYVAGPGYLGHREILRFEHD